MCRNPCLRLACFPRAELACGPRRLRPGLLSSQRRHFSHFWFLSDEEPCAYRTPADVFSDPADASLSLL